jgi:hypothetical protein
MKTPEQYYQLGQAKGQLEGWGPERVALYALRLQHTDWQTSSKSKVLELVTTANKLPDNGSPRK